MYATSGGAGNLGHTTYVRFRPKEPARPKGAPPPSSKLMRLRRDRLTDVSSPKIGLNGMRQTEA